MHAVPAALPPCTYRGIHGTPDPASAAPQPACTGGKVCLFDGHDFTGDVPQADRVDNPNLGLVWNRSDGFVCVWTAAGYRGRWFTIQQGQKQELLFAYDNAVTSLEYGGCGG